MSDPNIEILKYETLVRSIENSVDTKLFNSLMVRYKDSGTIADILNDGEYSCAFFVSSLLTLFEAIEKPHATVANLKKTIVEDPKWSEVERALAKPGDVVFYEKTVFDNGSAHEHVGFVVDTDSAVSTDYRQKNVARHDLDARPITSIYRYSWNRPT